MNKFRRDTGGRMEFGHTGYNLEDTESTKKFKIAYKKYLEKSKEIEQKKSWWKKIKNFFMIKND